MSRIETMYEYYGLQAVMPTFAAFRDEAELAAYEEGRRRLFVDKLHLPPRIFAGARILQYGPDTGEDALVYARWGGKLTLVEPNPRALPIVREYFSRFSLEAQLEALEPNTVEGYAAERGFDFVDAEGFIETVRPASTWLERFRSHLKDDGIFVINFYETTGAFVELCTKALYRAGRALRPAEPDVAVASALYRAKWDAVPHTRAFESWVMDVLENPWVRREFTLSAPDFCEGAARHGFELYSSWPVYREPLDVYWHKKNPDYAELRAASRGHLRRSTLSFLTGKKLYVVDDDAARFAAPLRRLERLGAQVDRLAGDYDAARCSDVAHELLVLHGEISSVRTFSDPAVRAEALGLLVSLARAFESAAVADWDGLIRLTSTDQVFVGNWGMPCHLAAFRRLPDL